MNASHVQRYIQAFEHLSPATLGHLEDCFAERARFVDPFNDVHDRPAIRGVFEHMFASCDDPRFSVDECLGDDQLVYLRWQFSFGKAPERRVVHGVSRVQFADNGLVTEHRDYWDPARQLYEKIPFLGRLFRALRNRLAAPSHNSSCTHSISSDTA
jgi:steroid delta-isomerase